jgi:hypothetical protein
MRLGRKIGGIDPEHPTSDTYWSPTFLPASTRLLAVSPGGDQLAMAGRGAGLIVRQVGRVQGRVGPIERHLPRSGVRFLSWAPDNTQLVYQQGGSLSILDVKTGATRSFFHLGTSVIHAAAWDPWSRVIALSVGAPGAPAASSRTLLVNTDGSGTGTLPMRGATSLYWSPWHGTTLGVTRATGKSTQAWAITLPALPPDPASALG